MTTICLALLQACSNGMQERGEEDRHTEIADNVKLARLTSSRSFYTINKEDTYIKHGEQE